MPSRFNQLIEPNKYVSQYVPLPLELINQQGAERQGEYDKTKGALSKSMLENSVKSIEEHDPYRNAYIKQFNDQAQELIGDPNIDFGSSEGKSKVANLIYQNSNNPNLQILSRSIENKKKTLDDLAKIKQDKEAYGYWNDPLLNEERMKQIGVNPYIDESGNPVEYQYRPIQRREDHFKPAEDIFKNIKDSGAITAYASPNEAQTYISSGKSGWEGVSAKTIKNVADKNVGTFINTSGGQDFIRKYEFDNAEELSKMTPEQVQNAEIDAARNHLYNIGTSFIHGKTMEDKDLQATSLLGKKYDEEQLKKSLIGQTIEGQTYNAIEGDENFKALKDYGVFNTNADGTIKINWAELQKDTGAESAYSNIGSGMTMGTSGVAGVGGKASKTKENKQKELLDQIKKMADVVGFKSKDIKADNYEQIVNAYNTLSKSRMYGEQLAAPVSNLESNKATRNWDLTTAFDPEDINTVALKPELKSGDKIVINQRQTNKNGEMIKKGYIKHSDGTILPIALKSNSIEDSSFFDKIGKLGVSSASYQAGVIGDGLSKTQDGFNVIESQNIPYIGNVTSVGNPKDKSQVQYRLVTENGERLKFDNYSDLQRHLEYEYYSKVPEGISDTQELISQQKQYTENYNEK